MKVFAVLPARVNHDFPGERYTVLLQVGDRLTVLTDPRKSGLTGAMVPRGVEMSFPDFYTSTAVELYAEPTADDVTEHLRLCGKPPPPLTPAPAAGKKRGRE